MTKRSPRKIKEKSSGGNLVAVGDKSDLFWYGFGCGQKAYG